MNDSTAIELRDIRVSRAGHGKRRRILDGVSFTLSANEVGVIAGPNGVGKTTLFEVLINSMRADSGTVQIDGGLAQEATLGVVWQRTYQSLMPWMTMLDNIALPLKLAGVPRRERCRRVHELCERTNLSVPLSRPPQATSGGEQQKACILRALARGASMLLLDEPFSNLSYDASIELLGHLQRIRVDSGLTILLISHSPELTVFMADVVIPFRSMPVRVGAQDMIRIECPYPSPRPLRWMHEESFQQQVRTVRAGTREQ